MAGKYSTIGFENCHHIKYTEARAAADEAIILKALHV
jgi:hypothetical protein